VGVFLDPKNGSAVCIPKMTQNGYFMDTKLVKKSVKVVPPEKPNEKVRRQFGACLFGVFGGLGRWDPDLPARSSPKPAALVAGYKRSFEIRLQNWPLKNTVFEKGTFVKITLPF
jgi:hypothetical protein